MIEVYHNDEFLFYMQEETMESLKKGHIESVAHVETDSLDEAYGLTQNIDQPWHQNTNVSAARRNTRSTSVGDLLKQGDKFFLVVSCGFKEITREQECELTFFSRQDLS